MISMHLVIHQWSASGDQYINTSICGCLQVGIFNAVAKEEFDNAEFQTMQVLYIVPGDNYIIIITSQNQRWTMLLVKYFDLSFFILLYLADLNAQS